MLTSNKDDIESINCQTEVSSLCILAEVFKEISIKKEEFYLLREVTWHRSSLDDMLALALAASIIEECERGTADFSPGNFQGLCNTVRFLYDFNHARFDGENYWFSPDKKIIAQMKKIGIK